MGFLDSLFGGGNRTERELSLSELEGWLLEEQRTEAGSVIQKAGPILREAKNLIEDIKRSVEQFDSIPMPQDMHERAEKIIKTSKPDYVKAMREELGRFDFGSTGTLSGLEDFSRRFGDSVNALGKIDATRGRYLSFVFEGEHKAIQQKGKRLIELQERLKDVLGSNESLKRISAALGESKKLEELRGSGERLAAESSRSKAEREGLEKGLSQLAARLKDESKKPEYAEIDLMQRRLAEARAKRLSLEGAVFQGIGQVKKDLAKYRRQMYEAPGESKGKILEALIENPVQAFIENDTPAIAGLLEDFRKAVSTEALKVKDKGKVLSRTEKAIKELSFGLKGEYLRMLSEEKDISSELGRKTANDGRRKIEDELKSTQEKISRLTEKVTEIEAKIRENKAGILAQKELLTTMLWELTDGGIKLKDD